MIGIIFGNPDGCSLELGQAGQDSAIKSYLVKDPAQLKANLFTGSARALHARVVDL